MSEQPPAPAQRRPPRVALVVKRSAWRIYREERKDPRITRLVEAGDAAIARLKASHESHEQTVREVKAALDDLGAQIDLITGAARTFDTSELDLVITVGGDGTLLSASHNVGEVPILGINSAPGHSVGFFCGATSVDAAEAIAKALRGSLRRTVLTRMQVTVNDKLASARVLNDALFCHVSPAATSRYVIRFGRVEEEQKSSGFWIGPAAGSTAAQRSAGGRVLPLTSKRLQLVVREPYTPHGEQYRFRHALIPPGASLVVRSKTHDAKLFFDGPIHSVSVGFGDVMEFTQAPQSLTILGLSAKRKWGAGSAASRR
ncbi:inorganic polyphosphate/ATP-NAD kinase [Sorangium cellulosum]|uniref:Inorganic polyphosphate/ATP-NAD kinase n=1 Tax=Sorangium cellulosum TaxID=56 RepID=A0A4V0NER1_SORCE|nr:NAD(+)/NADH kinase [Sorangium cellulosum]AUX27052.1 inorganic polyphosphate/ATP-NAD kinase [Sorangium cellulosum]